nr:transposase [Gloeocapsa sp. UFS-A4-WI-NPMV-4B04]
ANSEHTISFLDYLQTQRPNQRIAIIWDGAGPDRSQEVKDYLQSLNIGRAPSSSWQLTCLRFAPNAPEQNPVEDVWLQAKRFLREFYHLCDSFSLVKLLFELVTHGQTFNFPKLVEYAVFPQTT